MCANESAIVDGNHDPKAGYGISAPPCFLLGADEARVAGATAFGLDDAVAFYERGEAIDVEGRNLPWFWVDEYLHQIYVDLAARRRRRPATRVFWCGSRTRAARDALSMSNAIP